MLTIFHFSDPAQGTLMNIATDFKKQNPKKFKKKKDITFVGVHNRRGDHLNFQKEGEMKVES